MSFPVIRSANFQLKLLSLLLASLLWLFVALETSDQLEIPLSVSYGHIPAGLVVKTSALSGMSIRIEAPKILLLRQQLKGASVLLDLSGASEGRTVYSGLERSVKLVKGVKLLALSPVDAEVTLVPFK